MKTILTFIIVFGILVIVHEFGHFFFAKRSGILVREFAIGMGPKIYGHQAKDGTTYTLRLLPIGGYVRMAGNGDDETEMAPGMPLSLSLNSDGIVEKINLSKKVQLTNGIPVELVRYDLEDELTITAFVNGDDTEAVTYPVDHDATIIEADGTEIRIAPRDVQFQSAKLWQRMLTNFAGPMNNFILAIFLFIVLAFMQGGIQVTNTNQIGAVLPDGAAEVAGLKENDHILSINDKKITSWTDLTSQITANPGKTLNFEVQRDGKVQDIEVTPKSVESNGQKVGQLGIQAPMKTGFIDKIVGGTKQAFSSSLEIFKALGSLFTGFSLNKLGGPVMMFQLSSEAASQGMMTVIGLMAMLSMNLGIVNLLPIPALDGGKLVLNVIEGVRGKPLSQEKEGILTLIGFGFLMLLMVLVTWNDIQRFFF
ncbi:zinc metalloprotease [Enterococcus thailandicus]|uniref:Zinc metalloprotease n=1 Tax=Enterococcus thailandicus TaxID=417368 RepID=A0A510WCV3_ENTTH|nr:RIP metalloprotease RseP [Enterococcus thailandicus]MDK4351353.1 RIP metalloprotease RseP [Enterococcus thailandicus]MDT2732914.1 RIP metalloprotease RseP [Enterococcus thailandicus]MDT2794073.1 RIP metalloprotease RseP [Enterococcus thailandicus]MDT2846612.1 RIP metalloprotease RseP [Enterococcus thailandicus]MEA4830694.1 RIP metalloprotease RseP [Enterococcus thailandicus]